MVTDIKTSKDLKFWQSAFSVAKMCLNLIKDLPISKGVFSGQGKKINEIMNKNCESIKMLVASINSLHKKIDTIH